MKYITYLCLAVALVATTTATAQTKKKAPKKAPKTVAVQAKPSETDVAPPTRLVSDSEYSYAKGITHSEGLGYYLESQYKLYDEHHPLVAKGIRAYYMAKPEKKASIVALAAGMSAGTMTANEMLPHFNKMITDRTDTTYISDEAFLNGYAEEALQKVSGKTPRYTLEQARQIVMQQDQYIRLMKAKTAYEAQQAYVASQQGFKPLSDGIYYREVVAGKGEKPKAGQRVKVNYEGRLLDGKVFDSSYERGQPIVFGTNEVIRGWGIALQSMPVGATWEVVIPQELAYAERGAGEDIPPYAPLVFKIELISIEQ